MKTKLIVSMFSVAILSLVATNVWAQEVSEGTNTTATAAATVPVAAPLTMGECDECNGIAIGGGFGFVGPRVALEGARARRAARLGERRGIVQPSPYANPTGDLQDWGRFKNYPYGYYPQNFGASDMSVPKYNPTWQNFYPTARRFHEGKHFILDVF